MQSHFIWSVQDNINIKYKNKDYVTKSNPTQSMEWINLIHVHVWLRLLVDIQCLRNADNQVGEVLPILRPSDVQRRLFFHWIRPSCSRPFTLSTSRRHLILSSPPRTWILADSGWTRSVSVDVMRRFKERFYIYYSYHVYHVLIFSTFLL